MWWAGFAFLGFWMHLWNRGVFAIDRQSLVDTMVQHLQNLTVQEMCDLMLEIVRELQYRDYLARATRASPEIVPRSSRDTDSEDCSEWWSVLVAIAGLTVRRDLH